MQETERGKPMGPESEPGLVSARLARTGVAAWTLVGILAAGLLLGRLLSPLRPLLGVVVIAAVLVVLLAPAVQWGVDRGLPRGLATSAAFLLVAGAGAGAARLLFPVVVEQLTALIEALPDLVERVEERLDSVLDDLDLGVDLDAAGLSAALEDPGLRNAAVGSLVGVGSFAGSLVGQLFLLAFGPVIAFYVLLDLPRLHSSAVGLAPRRLRSSLDAFLREAAASVSAFVRGQLLVAAFVGVSTGLATAAIGIPYAAVIGTVAGVSNLIPFIGPFVGGALAVGVALATGEPVQAVAAAAAVLVIQQVESHVVSPLVVGRAVRLHPLAVLLAVVVGGLFAGFLGLLAAVPAVTVARAAVRHLGPKSAVDPAVAAEQPAAETPELPDTSTAAPPSGPDEPHQPSDEDR